MFEIFGPLTTVSFALKATKFRIKQTALLVFLNVSQNLNHETFQIVLLKFAKMSKKRFSIIWCHFEVIL